jgi:Na+/melibiose symporter-like transporter
LNLHLVLKIVLNCQDAKCAKGKRDSLILAILAPWRFSIASTGVLLKNGCMGVLVNVFAVILALLGCLFVIGYQGQAGRLIIGLILIGAGVVLFISSRLRPKQTTLVQKVDLTGDISTQELKCKNCGSTLTNKSVAVRAGAIFISCEFCGTQYQLEEAPKW